MKKCTAYQTVTYIPSGAISAVELTDTPEEAITRAKSWQKVGTRAEAVKIEVDLKTMDLVKTVIFA